MAGQRRVMAEQGVFGDGLARLYGLEERPEMWSQVVPIIAFVGFDNRGDGFLTGRRIVLLVPLVDVFLTHRARKPVGVVAGGSVFSALRIDTQAKFRAFQNPFRAMEAIDLG